ncbi:MAG: glycosyltransferase [Chloroflexi bacterium]|nr:glycosyltransferase [Chloroflexota bacterium]
MLELSIIIPTYNRAELLRACLAALSRQTQPASDFEVIVVVDGSSDGTLEMLAHQTTPFRLHVLTQPNSGAAVARNQGARAAAGALCLFLDDDIVAEPGLVTAHLDAQHQRGPMLGVGHLTCQPAMADGFARQFAAWWSDHYERLTDGSTAVSFLDCWSGNLSVPRATFMEAGGFATDLVRLEDVELGYRLQRLGLPLVYLPSAIGHQDYRKGFAAIAREVELSGMASVDLYRRHPTMLASLRMGRYAEGRLRFRIARRLLLALRPSIALLQLTSRIAGRRMPANTWYGLVFDHYYWRGVRRAMDDTAQWRRLTRGTPILLYHAFGRAGEPASRFVVPGRGFTRQMAWLRRKRYRVISLQDWLDCREQGRLPPERAVVITIDDGYADFLDVAYPVLRRNGFSVTLFVVSGAVGRSNDWDRGGALGGRALLSWDALEALGRDGVSYGAHSRTHRALPALGEAEVRDEVDSSRTELEKRLGAQVGAFAYPFGAADETCSSLVQAAGFRAACGIHPGGNDAGTPAYALRRTEIYGTDSLLRFAMAVRLGDALRRQL